MSRRFVVDTNVPVVANGTNSNPSLECQKAAIEFLTKLVDSGTILLDADGAIQDEYQRYLNRTGQPGVGDRFYLEVVNSSPGRVERVALPRDSQGNYRDFPKDRALSTFDISDRKFAALARRKRVPVANAVDSDWLHFKTALEVNNIKVSFLCGCDASKWHE